MIIHDFLILEDFFKKEDLLDFQEENFSELNASLPSEKKDFQKKKKPPQDERPLNFQDPDFFNEKMLREEINRVFDLCNTCRRCFSLCSFFPKLFDLMDQENIDGDPEKLSDKDIEDLVEFCTLCDLCHRIKCPYIPPHPWAIDVPRLILRYRSFLKTKKKKSFDVKTFTGSLMAHVDTYGQLSCFLSPMVNALMNQSWFRCLLESLAPVEKNALVPPFRSGLYWTRQKFLGSFGFSSEKSKIALFGGCLEHYYGPSCGQMRDLSSFSSQPSTASCCSKSSSSSCSSGLCGSSKIPCSSGPSDGENSCCKQSTIQQKSSSSQDNVALSALHLLSSLGLRAHYVYPGCCAMPLMEQGLLESAQGKTRKTAQHLVQYDKIFALGPSCALMMTKEWPALCPHDSHVLEVAQKVEDIHGFLGREILSCFKNSQHSYPSMNSSPTFPSDFIKIFYHAPCHERVQYHGLPLYDLLSFLFPHHTFLLENCSGHGGAWGYNHQEEALSQGKKTLQQVLREENPVLVTTPCPLALKHFEQLLQNTPHKVIHPLLLLHCLLFPL